MSDHESRKVYPLSPFVALLALLLLVEPLEDRFLPDTNLLRLEVCCGDEKAMVATEFPMNPSLWRGNLDVEIEKSSTATTTARSTGMVDGRIFFLRKPLRPEEIVEDCERLIVTPGKKGRADSSIRFDEYDL